MSIRKNTPCDYDGICPYDAEYSSTCEYWCGAEEPEDEIDFSDWEDEIDFDEIDFYETEELLDEIQ